MKRKLEDKFFTFDFTMLLSSEPNCQELLH